MDVFSRRVPLIQRLAGDAVGIPFGDCNGRFGDLACLPNSSTRSAARSRFFRKAFAHQLYGLRHTEGNGPDKFLLVVKKSEEFVD
jgi:hypothetical protein